MRVHQVNGQRIAFDHHGDSSAPAVVLLHGLSSNRRAYGQVIEHLAGAVASGSLQLLAVDMRGHGESSHAPADQYDASSYASDIADLIRSEMTEPAVIVGHSLGGVVAGALAANHPELVRGMFLEDPPYFEGDADVRNASPVAAIFPQVVAAVVALQARSAPATAYDLLVGPMVAPHEVAQRAAEMSRWDPMTMHAAVTGDVWRDFDPQAKVVCPLTIVRADPAFGAVFKPEDGPKVLAANPHANIVMVPGAGHQIREGETAGSYFRLLDQFLAGFLP